MSFTQPVQRRSSTKLRSMRLGYYFCGDCRQDTEGQAFFGERRPLSRSTIPYTPPRSLF